MRVQTKESRLGILGATLALCAAGSAPDDVVVTSESTIAQGNIVQTTESIRLGFNATFPFGPSISGDCCFGAFSYDIDVNTPIVLLMDLGVDVEFQYDRADILPGGSVPIKITYTPTGDEPIDFDLCISGNVTVDFTGCLNCPATVGLTLAAGTADFVAPLSGDAAVDVSLTSCSAAL